MSIFKILRSEIDFNSLEGISKIKIPKYKPLSTIQSPVNNIEYILQRKATEHKKNGRMDLAIACLRKSNEIMPHSNFSYQAKDYLRLVKYLKNYGQIEEAILVESNLKNQHPELFDLRIKNKQRINEYICKAKKYNEDLLYITTNNKCPVCKKYNHKVFSISGKSKTYPKLPPEFTTAGGFDTDCTIGVSINFN